MTDSTAQEATTTVTPSGTAPVEDVNNEVDWGTVSDDDFMNLDFESAEFVETPEEEKNPDEDIDPNLDENNDSDLLDSEEEDNEEQNAFSGNEEENSETTPPETAEEENTDSDQYKTAYEKIFAPFKANGQEIKVDSPEEVIRLMQMGANYHAKMAGLKPTLKTMRLLEKHNLLDENKLSGLIEANDGNKDAIQNLLKQHNLDPMELDTDSETDYKPSIKPVSEREYALHEVMEDLKTSPHYERTLQVVTRDWDSGSKEIVVNEPHLLGTINQHIASGMFDIVQAEVSKQRALGRLTGVSDIVAYKQVGDELDGRGAFDQLSTEGGTSKSQRAPIATKLRKTATATQNAQRAAAMPTRKTAQTQATTASFDPLDLSDEEFERQFGNL